jgi:3'(2'), 5'-bisphosphate nucleotidase
MKALLTELEAVATSAGHRILEMRASGTGWQIKADGSPVTDADHVAEDMILERLQQLCPAISIIAEERSGNGLSDLSTNEKFFLVDALDGTKEYIRGVDGFTVNIALIENGAPVLGVVAAPARGEVYSGALGLGAWRTHHATTGDAAKRNEICVGPPRDRWVAVCSASHMTPATKQLLDALPIVRQVAIGSSLKFCLVASGQADFYPRLGRTMQWDTAAGDAVVRAAGGHTLVREQKPLAYGPRALASHPFENPEFIVIGSQTPADMQQLSNAGWLVQ